MVIDKRQIDGHHDAIGDEQGVELTLDEVVFDVLDEVLIDDGVLVGIGIEEMVAAAVLVGILVGSALEHHAFHRVVGSHPQVENLLGRHAADRHLDVGRHARRGLEFVVGDEADFVVVADGVSFAEVDDGSAGHVFGAG
jgi:hypothetical protein